jgi:hypothetical protein
MPADNNLFAIEDFEYYFKAVYNQDIEAEWQGLEQQSIKKTCAFVLINAGSMSVSLSNMETIAVLKIAIVRSLPIKNDTFQKTHKDIQSSSWRVT